MERTIKLLLPIEQDSIVSLRYKVIRLGLLRKAYASIGEESKAKTFQQELEALPLKAKDTQWLEGYVSTLEGIDLQK